MDEPETEFDKEALEDWTKGFNDGYLISYHDEGLSEQMLEYLQSDAQYFSGFRCGSEEGGLERAEQLRIEELGEFERDDQDMGLELD